MNKIDIAGLKVDAITKSELLKELERRLESNQKTFITTLYSEFLYAALKDREVLDMLNKADVAVADGIGIMWAAKFLSIPLTLENYWLKIVQAFWQAKYSMAAILFRPSWIKSIRLPKNKSAFAEASADSRYYINKSWEKIVGADLVWDLAKLAAERNLSIYLLGGFGDTSKIASEKLQATNYKLQTFCSKKNPGDPTIIDDIKKANPDFLFVAFGPIRQERWITENLPNLPVKLAIGLGGTFDYLAGKRPNPPKFIRFAGFEWLYRLITQPHRIKRILKATFGLTIDLVKFKVFASLPFRQNVASVVLNDKNEIFVAKFNPDKTVLKLLGYDKKKRGEYWQFPQGGLEQDEDPAEGAKRELWEETAMRHVELIKVSDKTYSYTWKDSSQRPLFISRRYRYKGQEQRIVYFKFTGPEKEIVLDWDELVEYKWVLLDKLEQSVHKEKQPLAKIVLEDLKDLR